MRKKAAMLSIVVLVMFSSVAFAGVPFYRHFQSSGDDHSKSSACEYSRTHDGRGEDGSLQGDCD